MIVKALKTRADIFLYVLGSLLILTIFSACTQLPPPVPGGKDQRSTEVEQKNEQPIGNTGETGSTGITGETGSTGATQVEEIEIKIESDAAAALYHVMKIDKKAGKDEGTFVRQGVNYSCSDLKSKFECSFTLIMKDGMVKDKNTVVEGKADQEASDVGVSGKDPFVLYADLAKASYIDLSAELSKKIYSALQVEADHTLGNGERKRGENVNCVVTDFGTSIETRTYGCRIFIASWANGSLATVAP